MYHTSDTMIGTWGLKHNIFKLIMNKTVTFLNINIGEISPNPGASSLHGDQTKIPALKTRNTGSRTGHWPYCWTRAITVGLVLGSRKKEVTVSLSVFTAFNTGEEILVRKKHCCNWGQVVARYGWRTRQSLG